MLPASCLAGVEKASSNITIKQHYYFCCNSVVVEQWSLEFNPVGGWSQVVFPRAQFSLRGACSL